MICWAIQTFSDGRGMGTFPVISSLELERRGMRRLENQKPITLFNWACTLIFWSGRGFLRGDAGLFGIFTVKKCCTILIFLKACGPLDLCGWTTKVVSKPRDPSWPNKGEHCQPTGHPVSCAIGELLACKL